MKDCISLRVAQKLQKAGLTQEMKAHDWYWVKINGEFRLMALDDQEDPPSQTNLEWYKAHSTTQLMEELPLTIKNSNDVLAWLHIEFCAKKDQDINGKKSYIIGYKVSGMYKYVIGIGHESLPDAVGLLMEHLLINKHI